MLHSEWTGRFFLRVLSGSFTLDENPVEMGSVYPMEPGAILRDDHDQAVYLCDIENCSATDKTPAPSLLKPGMSTTVFPAATPDCTT
ncbi:MAG: hypothetical protein V2A34_01630 [Lentisphaerota bacterium]